MHRTDGGPDPTLQSDWSTLTRDGEGGADGRGVGDWEMSRDLIHSETIRFWRSTAVGLTTQTVGRSVHPDSRPFAVVKEVGTTPVPTVD